MRERLVDPLQEIIAQVEGLLQQADLEGLRHHILEGIHTQACAMLDLVISIPDFTWDRARELLSYESRSHLTAILGYAEELIEAPDSSMDDAQRTTLLAIENNGRLLLHRLTEDIE